MDIIEQKRKAKMSWLTRYPYDCRTLWVIGYPRSGTTFIARVFGDALQCPVFSLDEVSDQSDEIVTGKQHIESPFIVRRAHYTSPDYKDDNPYGPLPFKRNRGSKIVFVVRDPRDLVLSCHKYQGFTFDQNDNGLEKAARQMCGLEDRVAPIGVWRGKDRPGWAGYVGDWLDTVIDGIIRPGVLRYRDATASDGDHMFAMALRKSLFGSPDSQVFEEALANNTVEAWEARSDPALKFKRKTGVGHYKDDLPKHLQDMIVNECGDVMERLGYKIDE